MHDHDTYCIISPYDHTEISNVLWIVSMTSLPTPTHLVGYPQHKKWNISIQ